MKARTATKPEPKKEEAPKSDAPAIESSPAEKPANAEVKTDKPKDESEPALAEEKPVVKEETGSTADDADPKRRTPKVVNSRAAMLGEAPDTKRDVRILS